MVEGAVQRYSRTAALHAGYEPVSSCMDRKMRLRVSYEEMDDVKREVIVVVE